MIEVTCSMTMDVTYCWSRLKRVPNYAEQAGDMILLRLLEIEPKSRKIFRFSTQEDVRENPTFKKFGKTMVMMINSAVDLLGPDLDLLDEDLIKLGERHIRYGVQIEYLPKMASAVDYALANLLKTSYTSHHQHSWFAVLSYIESRMELGMKAAIRRMTLDVASSWDLLKRTPDYQDIAGELIFTRLFEVVPAARTLFGFTENEMIQQNVTFKIHARAMVHMIDKAVELLGPDLNPLNASLIKLGERHLTYGVKSDYLPYMRIALDYALLEVLGSKYTKGDKNSWEAVIDYMVSKMRVGMIE